MIFNLIPPIIDLQDFLKVGEEKSQNTKYVFRGMIAFYGKHYMAYFYSDKYDTWVQFDDDHIKSVGNFKQVMRKCVAGK